MYYHHVMPPGDTNLPFICRCGLGNRNKLSYEKFLCAFEGQRHSGYGRVTLDTPDKKPTTAVVFENHETLSPDKAIAKLRKKISSNYDTIVKVIGS